MRMVLDGCLYVTCMVFAYGRRTGAHAMVMAGRPASEGHLNRRHREGVEMAGLVPMSLDPPDETRPFKRGTGQVQL